MRVFITGATGYIGNAVAEAFRQAGHEVYGLIRSKEKSNFLLKKEIVPVIGDIKTPSSYIKELQAADAVIHCSFDPTGPAAAEKPLLDLMMSQPPRLLVYTSGVWVIGTTGNEIADEAFSIRPIELAKWRAEHEKRILGSAVKEKRVIVIRPGCVYGEGGGGDGGLTSIWFASVKSGAVDYVGNGDNRWAMIHVRDLARAYVLAAESDLREATLNIVDDSRSTVKEMALACADAAGIPGKIRSVSEEHANKRYGTFSQGMLINQQIDNAWVRQKLNWSPSHKRFIDDVARYYGAWLAYQN